MDRKLNYIFLFLLVVIFASFANATQQWNIAVGIFLAVAFSFLAFLLKKLTLDGMFASTVIGAFIFGVGGWAATFVVLLFFISSVYLSGAWKISLSDFPVEVRRDGYQVWANGIWVVLFLALSTIFNESLFIAGAMAAVAVATADTWATEIGVRTGGDTYLITTQQKVAPGVDGGISFKGTLAAMAGSGLIAAATVLFFALHFVVFLSIFVAGFLGSLLDSYFGAILQRNNVSVTLPVVQTQVHIDNNIVNGISTGAGALLAIILKLMLL